jgi:hypothetical protein
MYCLISDDDGHWYVCPIDTDKIDMAYDYFENPNELDKPDFLDAVNGWPGRVRFPSYEII